MAPKMIPVATAPPAAGTLASPYITHFAALIKSMAGHRPTNMFKTKQYILNILNNNFFLKKLNITTSNNALLKKEILHLNITQITTSLNKLKLKKIYIKNIINWNLTYNVV